MCDDPNVKISSVGYNANELVPNRRNILLRLYDITTKTQSGDTLFIHYSGHGMQMKDTNGNEKNNQDTPGMEDCICPCDFNNGVICDDDLNATVIAKLPPGAKLRGFFDACHSGSILNLEFMWKNDNLIIDQYPGEMLNNDCLTISGCRDSQTSADAWNAQKREAEGALTMAIIDTLKNIGNIKTTWKELLLLVRHYLAQNGYSQIPMLAIGNKALTDKLVDL